MSAFNHFFFGRTSQNPLQENLPMLEAIEPAPPFGLKILAEGNDPRVDVVAIHGLDGHRENSWTAKNGTLWLRDLLPEKLPNARIITYGYDAHTHGQQQLTTQHLYDHGTTLITNLVLFRNETSTEEHPIIFVAHSLGGILLKSALIQLHLGDNSPDRRALASSIYGILFFGSPHRGSTTAELGSVVLNIKSIFTPTSDVLIRYLKKDSEIIQQQLLQFASISQKFDIKFFYELYPTEVAPGIKIMLVPKYSAVPDAVNDTVGFGLYKDHVNMVKFTSATDCDFWAVSRHLLLMARKAIAARTSDMEHGPIAEHPRPGLRDSDQTPLRGLPVTQEPNAEDYPTATGNRGNVESTMSLSEDNAQEDIQGSSTANLRFRDLAIPQPDNQGWETAREETNVRAGLYSVENGGGSYPLTSAVCHYQVIDVQVGASLVQNYVSDATAMHEVAYVFPLPQDAAVCSFKAIVDGKRTITGVVKEKMEAKQDYKKAVATGRTAALLEKHHADIFQVSLGNIKPKQTISIHISFVAVIAHDSAPESLRLMIPVTIAPRYGSTSPIPPPNCGSTTVTNPKLHVTLSVQMTGPIISITSPTHRIGLTFGTASVVPSDPHDPTKAYLSLENETFLEKDIVIIIASQMLDHPRCIAETHGQKGTDAYALTLVPQFDLPPLQHQEYLFLVDRSGSMAGRRIQTVRTALQIMLRSLPTQDTSFNIWSFGSSYSSLWPISRAYSVHSMREAAAHIDSFDANYGGTEISNAFQAVFECAKPQRDSTQNLPRAIFLLTDGEAWDVQGVVSRVRRAAEHAKAESSLLRTFVLGIGDNVSTPMCEGIARASKGIAVFVGNHENPEGKLMRLLKAARGPVIDDLAVDWGVGNDVAEADEFELDQDWAESGPIVPATPIHLFGGPSNLAQGQISLGPGRVVVKLPPPPRIQQAPLTEKLFIPLYPGFRCSIFAIIKRDENGPVPSIVRLTGQVLGCPVVLEVSVTRSTPFPLRDLGDNPEVLHVLAARSLIQALEDLPKSDESDAKIIRLATQYSLTSCYTSFIAIDEEENSILVPLVDEDWQAAAVLSPPPLQMQRACGPSVPSALRIPARLSVTPEWQTGPMCLRPLPPLQMQRACDSSVPSSRIPSRLLMAGGSQAAAGSSLRVLSPPPFQMQRNFCSGFPSPKIPSVLRIVSGSSVSPPTMSGPSASYFSHRYDSTTQFNGDSLRYTNPCRSDPVLTPPPPVYIRQSTDSLFPTAPYSPIQQDNGSSGAGLFSPNLYSPHESFSSPGVALSFNNAGEAQFADAVTYSPQELYFPEFQRTSFSQHQLGGSSFPSLDTSSSPQEWRYISPTHWQIHRSSSSTSPLHPRSVTKTAKKTRQRPVPYQRGGRAGKVPASDSGDDGHRPPPNSRHQAVSATSSQNLAAIARTSGTSSGFKDERVHKDYLAWIENAQATERAQIVDKGSFLSDTRGILVPNESDSEEEVNSDSSADEDMNPDSLSKGLANGKGKQKVEKRKENNSPKLHALPEKTTPIGLLAHLSLSEMKGRARSRGQPSSCGDLATGDGENEARPGLADPDYFRPGPVADPDLRRIIIERQMAPEILTSGLITPDEVEKLFGIFFDKLNVFLSILDPVIHTPATIFGRCPFLFTVICAISSRYYTERPHLYHFAMHYAKTSAASTLIYGWKSVEICQAYILLTVYPDPARRWEEERTWLYLGLAIRMATDLNLHRHSTTKFVNEQHEREILNRTRTWLICFNLDRSCSAQLGKPTSIREDWIIRNSKEWYKKSKYNSKMDIHLCTYSILLRIMARFQEVAYSDPNSPTGLNRRLDYRAVTFSFDEELQAFKAEADAIFHLHSDKTDPVCVYRATLLPFLVNYSRLVILSFGFQQAYQEGILPGRDVVVKCLDAASAVVSIMVNNLAPKDFLRYAPDGHFVFAAFATAFLIKMLRLEFKSLLDEDQRSQVILLVGKLVKVLRSPEVAVDDRHTPKLYAKFLAGLLSKYVIRPGERRANTNEHGSGPNGAVLTNNSIHDDSLGSYTCGRQTTMDGVVQNIHRNGTNGIGQPMTVDISATLSENAIYSFGEDAVTRYLVQSTPLSRDGTTSDAGQQIGQLHQTQHHLNSSIEIVPPVDIFAHQNEGFAHTNLLTSHIPDPHIFSLYSQMDHFSPTTFNQIYGSSALTAQSADTGTQMDYIAPPQEPDLLPSMYAVNSTNFWNHMMLPAGFSRPAEDAPLPWDISIDTEGMGVPMVGIHTPIPDPPV